MATRQQYVSEVPAAKVRIIRQDVLPAAPTVAGIKRSTATPPASKIACDEQATVQWPPERNGMHIRQNISASPDDRRLSWAIDEETLCPTPRSVHKIKPVTSITESIVKPLPTELCKVWRKKASFHTAPQA
jgi:hypothetical protein